MRRVHSPDAAQDSCGSPAVADRRHTVILDDVRQAPVELEYIDRLPKITTPSDAENARIETVVRGALEAASLQKTVSLLNGARDDGRITAGAALFGKALACERAGDTKNALRYVKKSDRVGRDYGSPYAFRAGLLYRLEYREELREWWKMWFDMDGERNHMHLTKARLMHMDGDHDGARDHLETILVLENSMGDAYELGGDLRVDAGDRRGALRWYTKSINMDPTTPYVHVKRARLLAEMGNLDLAARACRYGLRVHPRNAELRRILGDAKRAHS